MSGKPNSPLNRSKDGHETVLRIVDLVNNLPFIKTEILSRENLQIDSGQNYEPDMEIFFPRHYAVEVKGMFVSWKKVDDRERMSWLRLPSYQWFNLVDWSKIHKAIPIVIVELKTRSRYLPFIYRVLTQKTMNAFLQRFAGDWISPNIWEILEYGNSVYDLVIV